MARKSRKSICLLDENSRNITSSLSDNKEKETGTASYTFRVALYGRLSREEEDNRERGTIEIQMQLLENYVQNADDMVVYDRYYDLSYSGRNFERPEFQRMIEDMKSGKINCIITKDLSRLGRNYVETGTYIERVFPFFGVRYIAVTDDFDSFRPGADLMMPLKNIVNEYYAKDIQKKVIESLYAIRKKGKFLHNTTPYGYMLDKEDNHHLVIDERVKDIVIRIHRMFLEGGRYGEIADVLEAEGILYPEAYRESVGLSTSGLKRSERKDRWTGQRVKNILICKYYAGDSYYRKKELDKNIDSPDGGFVKIPCTHEPIITHEMQEAVWKQVEQLRKEYHQNYKPKGSTAEQNLFRKKVFCSECMKSQSLQKHRKRMIYRCTTHDKSEVHSSSVHSIEKQDLEKQVFGVIHQHMKICIDTVSMINRLNSSTKNTVKYEVLSKEITRLQKEIQKETAQKSSLYMDYCEKLIGEEQYLEYSAMSDNILCELKQSLDDILTAQAGYARNYRIDEDWSATIQKFLNKRKLTKEMVDAFVESIIVDQNSRCQIKLKFDDNLQSLLMQEQERGVVDDAV